jgi:cation transport ATPase
MHHYMHHLPGRLRIKSASLKRNEHHARRVSEYLRSIDGVVQADVNLLTGSLLIHYDVALVRSETLLNSLKHLGCLHPHTDVARPATRNVHPMVQRVSDKVVEKAVETLIERSAVATVAAIL